MSTDWKSLAPALERCPVIPVLTVRDPAHAAPLAQALASAGMTLLEVTLRTDCALEVIRIMTEAAPDTCVGGGTALTPADIDAIIDAGGRFIVSPGAPSELLAAGASAKVLLIPGVATVTEAMAARNAGFRFLKFFPAGTSGGAAALKAFAAPLADLVFCPTGGVNPENLAEYLALPNVVAVGGSWMVPDKLIKAGRFDDVRDIATRAVEQARSYNSAIRSSTRANRS
ncbi:MAG: bifunctional 4-hydroxy-2-oxoglutarate aldolase/2-dehydro-3-deoxy-phosphogluconate aldolase [Gammaproteobacteria bacterium]|nr:bifunctional 4-hydroxy-2-oxoglutarate aldolase/2-dehydro-3-deoxy-phosphogluconate aldolase [Gammaproteobacteria bacterium]